MSHIPESKFQERKAPQVPIGSLIQVLHNIQLHINTASGAATALDLRFRIIAQLEPKVQVALAKKTRDPYYKAGLGQLIDSVLEVFHDILDPADRAKIKNCHQPRNKAVHGSFAELMIHLHGEAAGREINPRSGKYNPLPEDDIIEGALCIERNQGLEEFCRRANEAINILEEKIIRSLGP